MVAIGNIKHIIAEVYSDQSDGGSVALGWIGNGCFLLDGSEE